MTDRFVQYGADDYAAAIECELPRGSAWSRKPDSGLMRWVRGCSKVWADVSAATALLMLVESDPRFTVEMLEDWEDAYGLPDPCIATPQTVAQRRAALINRITIQGSCQKQFFIDLAAGLGYTVTITEYVPFCFGISSFGVGPGNAWLEPQSRYYWTVNIHHQALKRFQFGYSNTGTDRFLDFKRADDLICTINRWKPAHTIAIYNYVND